jgi:WD40 repeat protein
VSLVPALCLAAALAAETRFDAEGFPLPREAIRRIGSARFLTGDWNSRCVGYTADGRTLITAWHSVIAWDAVTGHARWRYSPPRTRFTAGAISPDGKFVWLIAQRHAKESSTETASVLRLSAHDGTLVSQVVLGAVSVFHMAPTGRLVVLRDFRTSHRIDLLDGATGSLLGSWPEPNRESITSARVAPDGKRVAVASTRDRERGSGESHIRIWEPATGRIQQEIWAGGAPPRPVFTLRFSPDGRRLYALLAPGQWNNNRIPDSMLRSWDLQTGAPLFAFAVKAACEDGTMSAPESLAISPDGKRAAIGGWQRPTQIYNLPDGTLRCWMPIRANYVLVFDPTGATLAIGGRAITQWDATTGKRLAHSPPPCPNGWLAFSADGQRLMVRPTGYSDRFEWNVRTGREVCRVLSSDTTQGGWIGRCGGIGSSQHPLVLRSVDGSLTAQFLMHRENQQHPDNGKILLRDGQTGRQLHILPRGGNFTYGLAFSTDGRFLANDLFMTVSVYDTATGKAAYQITPRREPTGSMTMSAYGRLYPSPDGRHLAIIEMNTTDQPTCRWVIGVYELKTGKEVRRFRGTGTLSELTWSAGGTRIAVVGAWNGLRQQQGGIVFVGDLSTDHPPLRATRTSQHCVAAALSPDGRMLAVSMDGAIQLWEVATGKIRHTFVGLRFAARSLAFAPDGRALASISADGPVLLWDVRGELARAKTPPDAATLGRAWDALACDDAEQAYRAIRRLAHAPQQALPFLKRKLDAAPPKPEQIAALIQQLDSPAFADRQRAEAELRSLVEWATPALRKVAIGSRSAEVQQRAERILNASVRMTPQRLRVIRAVEALEWIGGPDAVELLERITYGSAEARAAIGRLRR